MSPTAEVLSATPATALRSDSTISSTRNFEKAITLCSGELIALSDQDDVWVTHKLERIQAEFLKRPDVGLIFTDAEVVDRNLQPLGFTLWEKLGFDQRMRRRINTERHKLEVLLPGWTVTGATMAFRANFRDLVLEIPIDLNMIHDGWISLMIAAVASVGFIEEGLVKYRQHPLQQIGAPTKELNEQLDGDWVGSMKSAMKRPTSYESLIAIAERVRERLLARASQYDSREALKSLDARIVHMRSRLNLPDPILKRLPGVLRELGTGRYHRYSRGFFSAAKDLLSSGEMSRS